MTCMFTKGLIYQDKQKSDAVCWPWGTLVSVTDGSAPRCPTSWDSAWRRLSDGGWRRWASTGCLGWPQTSRPWRLPSTPVSGTRPHSHPNPPMLSSCYIHLLIDLSPKGPYVLQQDQHQNCCGIHKIPKTPLKYHIKQFKIQQMNPQQQPQTISPLTALLLPPTPKVNGEIAVEMKEWLYPLLFDVLCFYLMDFAFSAHSQLKQINVIYLYSQ